MSRVSIPSTFASEFHDIVGSMSGGKPLIPNTVNLLQILVDVFQKGWICNFLFTNEPVHIPHLNSPALAHSALTCDLRVTDVNVTGTHPSSPANAIDSHRFCARYLFVPCFSVEDITTGVGVMESYETKITGGEADSPSLFHNMRFVRDSRRRFMLAVMDSPDEDVVLMHYSATDSRLCPYTLAIKFRRRELFAVAREGLYQLNLQTLQASLIQYRHTSHLRSCPKCSAPPASGCICYYDTMHLPRHPFDTENFKLSISQDFGSYQGLTNKVVSQANGPVSHVFFGAHSSFQPVLDPDSVHRMTRWALGQHARSFMEGPRAPLQFPMRGTKEADEGETQTMEVIGGPSFGIGHPDPGEEIHEQMSHQRRDTSVRSAEQGVTSHPMDTGDNSLHFGHIPIIPVENAPRDSGQGPDMNYLEQPFPVAQSSPDSNKRPATSDKQYREEIAEIFAQKEGQLNHYTTFAADEDEQDIDIQKDVCLSSSGSFSAADEVQGSKYESCSPARSIAKELQAARRRLQNRASAHRSNMKKKAFINDMKEKLRISKERIETLREREMTLRLENLKLRKDVDKL